MRTLPFVLVWLVPVVYRIYELENHHRVDELLYVASHLAMGWLNFLLLLQSRGALLALGTGVAPQGRRPVLSVDARGSPGAWAACRRADAVRPDLGRGQRGLRQLGRLRRAWARARS